MSGSIGEGAPQANPDRRVVEIRVDTIPPGLLVRLLGTVISGLREDIGVSDEKIGPSPQTISTKYNPNFESGFGLQYMVRAFPMHQPRPGETVELISTVLVDGAELEEAGDRAEVTEDTIRTAFVMSVFDARLVPPTGEEAG